MTATHPDKTRFFTTIPGACQLVLQVGLTGLPQDVLIIDMGRPVKILDIPNRIIELYGKKKEIVFAGLRMGEKLHNHLCGAPEDSAVLARHLIPHAEAVPLPLVDMTQSDLS